MKKCLKAIGISFGYMAIYLVSQMVYLSAIGFIFGIKYGTRGLSEEQFMERLQQVLSIHTHIAIILAAIISIFIYSQILKKRGQKLLKVCSFERISVTNVFLSLLAGAAFLFINGYVIEVIYKTGLLTKYMESFEEFSSLISSANMVLVIISVGVVAPIIEEVIFRGLIMKELKSYMPMVWVVIVQAVLFGIFHMRVIQAIYATLLGLMLGVVYLFVKSILAPIILHMFYNLTSIMLSSYGQETIFMKYYRGFVFLSAVIVVLILMYMYKNKGQKIEDGEIIV